MAREPKTIVIGAFDPDGVPRAWGSGPDEQTASVMAEHQLMLYREKKRSTGDPLAFAKFTFARIQG